MKNESPDKALRTIVCRETVPGPKKDRWHVLYTSSQAAPLKVLQNFRTRQHHEQGEGNASCHAMGRIDAPQLCC